MEICDERKNITMCPLCDRVCSYWNLSIACGTARASHLFDNPTTVFFSIFMALWGEIWPSSFLLLFVWTHTHAVLHILAWFTFAPTEDCIRVGAGDSGLKDSQRCPLNACAKRVVLKFTVHALTVNLPKILLGNLALRCGLEIGSGLVPSYHPVISNCYNK